MIADGVGEEDEEDLKSFLMLLIIHFFFVFLLHFNHQIIYCVSHNLINENDMKTLPQWAMKKHTQIHIKMREEVACSRL